MGLRFFRRTHSVASTFALSIALIFLASAAPFKSYKEFPDSKKDSHKPEVGQTYRIDPKDLRPTQFAVGQEEIDARADRFQDLHKSKRQEYLESKVGHVVIGPGGTPWIVDGHHLARVVEKTGHQRMLIQVTADWSSLPMPEFLARMEKENYIWPYDENGVRRPASELPDNIKKLKDDPYRSLARAVSKRGGFEKTSVPFQEFIWANYFREHIPKSLLKEHPEKAVEEALKLTASPLAMHYPGYHPASCVYRAIADIEKH